MLPVEDGQYVTFEWIGHENYLGEKVPRTGKRTRGANCTSADAAVLFERTDGTRQIVLIEWKYTESYGGAPLKIAKSGTDRTAIYQPLFDREDCPLDKKLVPAFEALFFEPFYQFMRQQFLAHEMEQAKEFGASTVSVLHIAPDAQHGLSESHVASPSWPSARPRRTSGRRWCDRLTDSSASARSICSAPCPVDHLPDMGAWLDYIGARYPWVRAGKPSVSQCDQRRTLTCFRDSFRLSGFSSLLPS